MAGLCPKGLGSGKCLSHSGCTTPCGPGSCEQFKASIKSLSLLPPSPLPGRQRLETPPSGLAIKCDAILQHAARTSSHNLRDNRNINAFTPPSQSFEQFRACVAVFTSLHECKTAPSSELSRLVLGTLSFSLVPHCHAFSWRQAIVSQTTLSPPEQMNARQPHRRSLHLFGRTQTG